MSEPKPAPLWLSLGENCLPDDILRRHALKSFSTPYSSGRSNIDYALALEQSDYAGLVEPENLVNGDAWGKKVVRSSRIVDAEDIFDPSCAKGFEFTHHDPITSLKDKDSILRKIARLQNARRKTDIVFLYHHRHSRKSDLAKLKDKLSRFQAVYSTPEVNCYMALFHQVVLGNAAERRLMTNAIGPHMVEFVFHTEFLWGGNHEDIFWARNDDDLIRQMLGHLQHLTG